MRVLCLPGQAMDTDTVVCLGFFDGVHIGHKRLIQQALAISGRTGLCACVHTFDAMPSRVLRPDRNVRELTPLPEKIDLLTALGVDAVAVSAFAETMAMLPELFFDEVLRCALRARHLVVGFHHHFGYQGSGDVTLLRSLCEAADIGLDVIAPVTLPDGRLVSSTAIRSALAQGDIRTAEAMLGRPYGQE